MTETPPSKKQKLENNKISMNNEVFDSSDSIKSNVVEINALEIDESLYSRQIYVMGTDAMKSMSNSKILISGLGGLGLEIAKNVILAGVKSVTLHDTELVTEWDLSSQYYFTEAEVGNNRVISCKRHLIELNSYVEINTLETELSNNLIENFDVVVLTNQNYNIINNISNFCHINKVKLIVARTVGLCGMIFCDMGPEHVIIDSTGEEPLSVMIQQINNDTEGLVLCLEETRHGFQDGDYVTFSEVEGMTKINNSKPRKITVDGPASIKVGDLSNFSTNGAGGICTQVKIPITETYKNFEDACKTPDFIISDFAKCDRPPQLHVLFLALDTLISKYGHLLSLPIEKSEFVSIVKELEVTFSVNIDDKLLMTFFATAAGNCTPMCSIIGGISAQEVLKACSGKFTPIKQFFYFDAFECLPEDNSILGPPNHNSCMENTYSDIGTNLSVSKVIGSGESNIYRRYCAQIAIFGESFQERLSNCRVFVVGAGAIGCEILKNLAMMGVGTNESVRGKITITDMDNIEKSNLNRQFLFRNSDIHKLKSVIAVKSVRKMNLSLNIEAFDMKVGRETESYFNDDFYDGIDVVINALDNVEARQYVDRRCVFYERALLESGTLGTKANVQVIIPHYTESYSSSQDPPEKSIPVCTLKNFPYMIEHTIQWARDLFEGIFSQPSLSANQFLSHKDQFLESVNKSQSYENVDQVLNLLNSIPKSFNDCIIWSKNMWQEHFCNNIKQLLHNFPSDSVASRGLPFWSGTKRCPKPLEFNVHNQTHFDFVFSAAKIRAYIYNIDSSIFDLESVQSMIEHCHLPAFVPKSDVKIPTTENEANKMAELNVDSRKLETLIKKLELLTHKSKLIKINIVEFEKDYDLNFHMNFITSASNLRAENYCIEPVDRLRTKLIAGKIIPAIATTTSMVAGLVCLELYKIVQGHKKLELYKNGFINLALPFFGFSEPIPPQVKTYGEKKFTLWDRYELVHPMTLQQLIDYFKNEHNLIVTMLTQDVSMIYAFFQTEKIKQQRLKMILTDLIETVSRKPIPMNTKSLVIEMSCTDLEGEDVDVPYIKYNMQ